MGKGIRLPTRDILQFEGGSPPNRTLHNNTAGQLKGLATWLISGEGILTRVPLLRPIRLPLMDPQH